MLRGGHSLNGYAVVSMFHRSVSIITANVAPGKEDLFDLSDMLFPATANNKLDAMAGWGAGGWVNPPQPASPLGSKAGICA